MLRPEFLNEMSWAMAEVYGAVVDRILINLAKYFPYIHLGGEPLDLFNYEARMLAQLGQINQETMEIIAAGLEGADEALRKVLQDAIMDAIKDEEPALRKAAEQGLLQPGFLPPPVDPGTMQAFEAYYRQSADRLNLVNTVMLESTQEAYLATVGDVTAQIAVTQSALNIAAGEVVAGVSTFNEAVRNAVDRMVDNGLTGFIDHGGHHWSPEAYVAMDIRTTTANAARDAMLERNAEYGNDLYQVSSHDGARPLCYPWQGKILSTSGRTGKTEDLDGNEYIIHSESEVESFRYGGGLFGVNCGHFPIPFIPRFSTIKGEPQDKEDNDKKYAESQEQRALERKLREERRQLEILKQQGAGAQEIAAQQARVDRASDAIEDFCDSTGRARHRDREYTPINATWPE